MTLLKDINKQVIVKPASEIQDKIFDDLLFEASEIALWRFNLLDAVLYASPYFFELLGIEPNNGIDEFFLRKHLGSSYRKLVGNVAKILNNQPVVLKEEIQYKHPKQSEILWLQITMRNHLWDDKDGTQEIAGVIQDITALKKVQTDANAEHQLYRSLFRHSPTGIFSIEQSGEVIEANNAFYHILTLQPKHKFNIKQIVIGDSKEKISAYDWLKRYGGIRNRVVECEINGTWIYMNMSVKKSIWGEELTYDGTLSDISERIRAQKRNEWLVNHDSMTGLYNRFAFESQFWAEELMRPVALILVDVDGLKLINDAFGHAEGDKVLTKVADTLRAVYPHAFIARIGGDEFAVIQENAMDADTIEDKTEEFVRSASHMYHLDINTGASVGYAYIADGDLLDDAFRKAENMMYRSKLTERSSRKSKALISLIAALHERTSETQRHCENVSKLASAILLKLGQRRKSELSDMRLLAKLHDIGKLTIPMHLIKKQDSLNEKELAIIEQHSEAGFKIASNMIEGSYVAEGILYHHENWDGTGYPYGLSGDSIPLFSRIISVADTYDVMTSSDPFGKGMSHEQALDEIKGRSGSQFDPTIVKALLMLRFDELDLR